MELRVVEDGPNRIVAVETGQGLCPVFDFLSQLPADMQASARGLRPLFQLYALHGRPGLTTALFHEVDKREGIWEFIKGRLRILCFIDGGHLIVLTHGLIKKSQKTPVAEIAHACRIKKDYLNAKQSGHLVFKPPRSPS